MRCGSRATSKVGRFSRVGVLGSLFVGVESVLRLLLLLPQLGCQVPPTAPNRPPPKQNAPPPGVRSQIAVPRPVPGLVTEGVYAMEWMAGESVAKYMREPSPLNTEVGAITGGDGAALVQCVHAGSRPLCGAASRLFCAVVIPHVSNAPSHSPAHRPNPHAPTPRPTNQVVALGVDCYVQMLMTDNFVHTDLHPGNIMVQRLPQHHAHHQQAVIVAEARHAQHGRRHAHHEQQQQPQRQSEKERARLILLDFGLAEELTPEVRYRFISFLNHIVGGELVWLVWLKVLGCFGVSWC
jgi:hypothetical protein